MFSWLRKSRRARDSASSSTRRSARDNPHFLHDPDEILALLRDLKESSTVISLYFPDRPHDGYGSVLTGVGRGALLLDQVAHPQGHKELLSQKTFRALSKHKGITVTFDCRLLGIVEVGGALRYRVAFPERIFYPQKREFFRVQVRSLQLVLHIPRNDASGAESLLEARVEDLGPRGIGFILEGEYFFRKLDVLRHCVLHLPDGRPLGFDIEVRNVRKLGRGGRQRIGARFVNLSQKNVARLRREVTVLQRRLRAEETA